MKMLFRVTLITALSLTLIGALKVPQLPVPPGAVEIYNPGTGDFTGFRIVVDRAGKAWSIDGAGRAQAVLQKTVADTLFGDLAAAKPLSKLPPGECAPAGNLDPSAISMVVNSEIVVAWNGDRSPDLRCATDPRASALVADVQTIQRTLYVQAYRIRPGAMMFGGASVGGSQPPPAQPPSGYGGMGYP